MISASKITLSLNNLKILRPKVTKNLTNLGKKFYESSPSLVSNFERKLQNRLKLCSENQVSTKIPGWIDYFLVKYML